MIALDQLLDDIAAQGSLATVAIAECLVRFDEAAPRLRAILERAADGRLETAEDRNLLFVGVHILGGGRDALSCAPLLRLLRRLDWDELDELLGDAKTETLPRIIAGVFDGDDEALFAAIADRDLDVLLRYGLFGALSFLTWEGRIDRSRTIGFLERFDDERLAGDEDIAWSGWADAIASLGLRSHVARVDEAWREKRVDDTFDDYEEWAKELARAEAEPASYERFRAQGLGYLDDVLDALAWFGDPADAIEGDPGEVEDWLPASPAINEWRRVGRNDPCPCGSGKKFKKCCLGKSPEIAPRATE